MYVPVFGIIFCVKSSFFLLTLDNTVYRYKRFCNILKLFQLNLANEETIAFFIYIAECYLFLRSNFVRKSLCLQYTCELLIECN